MVIIYGKGEPVFHWGDFIFVAIVIVVGVIGYAAGYGRGRQAGEDALRQKIQAPIDQELQKLKEPWGPVH